MSGSRLTNSRQTVRRRRYLRPIWHPPESRAGCPVRSSRGARDASIRHCLAVGCPIPDTHAVISVVIPAHNESAVIGRLLSGLLAGAAPDEFDVIVVANGCTDDTAKVAGRFGPAVTVLTSPIPSKAAAMRLGDEKAHGFPRLYMDADVELTTAGARALAAALVEPGVLAVAPEREIASGWACCPT
jgi:cellulose synthase/poly-beta-1,6-N-acetylglucosamine synthase-like glycosyltransferase